jgi:hypothetical protein
VKHTDIHRAELDEYDLWSVVPSAYTGETGTRADFGGLRGEKRG